MDIREELHAAIRQARRDARTSTKTSTEVELDALEAVTALYAQVVRAEAVESSVFDGVTPWGRVGGSTWRIARQVAAARVRAREKHGANSIEAITAGDARWLPILVEEVGEVAHELTYDASGSLRGELLDVASVVFAWIAAIDEVRK